MTMQPLSSRGQSSYLVRVWLEPREGDGTPQLRCYIRDLKTGEELYTADPRLLTDHLLSRAKTEMTTTADRDSKKDASRRH